MASSYIKASRRAFKRSSYHLSMAYKNLPLASSSIAHFSVSFPMPISNPWSWYADCGMQDCQTGERGRGFNPLRRDSTPSCESDNVVFFICLFWWLILIYIRYVRVHSTPRHL